MQHSWFAVAALRMVSALLMLTSLGVAATASAGQLQAIDDVRLIPTDWADGDSFRVQFPDGQQHTVRLYGADCFEWHVRDRSDARRLRAQRRYFGITRHGGGGVPSIELAKSLGEAAALEVRRQLARPFKVYTAFADGGGDGRYKRIYGFVTTASGQDLATELVARGLARAFGVYHSSPQGLSRNDYRESLRDAELVAATARKGAWAYTDWDALAAQRSEQRREEAELKMSTSRQRPDRVLDLNTAARDELMRIPGIGEVLANAMIEQRPYRTVDELLKVHGIGAKRLASFRRWLRVLP